MDARTLSSGRESDKVLASQCDETLDYDRRVVKRSQRASGLSKEMPANSKPVPDIDDLDKRIIRILTHDGRASNVEIARSLSVTETTVRKRIANLLAEGLIEIVAVPTPRLAGFSISAIMGLNVSLQELRSVSDHLVDLPEVRYCGLSTGRFDIMIEAFFSNHEHLLTFSSETVGSIPGVIKVETFLILDITKFSYEWEIDLP